MPGQHLPAPLNRKLLWGWPGNPLQRRGPQTSCLVGRRCYIPPNPWWLLDRSPSIERSKTEACNWGEGLVQIPQTEGPKVMTTLQEPPLLTQEFNIIWWAMLPPSFLGVAVCLRRDQSLEGAHLHPLMIGVMFVPGVATMSTSHIVKDEVTGVTYMDTVITSVGRVALSGPE